MENIEDGGKLHADHWSTEYEAHLLQTSERRRIAYGRILASLHSSPKTDDELRAGLAVYGPVSKSGPATRRGELVEMGLVRPMRVDRGRRTTEVLKRPSDLGGPMIVWEVVPPFDLPDVPTEPRPKSERQPKGRGLDVARRAAMWEIGDSAWADTILRAYLNPDLADRELDEQGAR